MKAKMGDFDRWWGMQPKDPTEPITPRMAWDAAMIYSAQAANERIRELRARLARSEMATTAEAGYADALRALLTAEREVSDKLETALKTLLNTPSIYMGGAHGSEHQFYGRIGEARESADAALAEVAAIREKEKA